MLGFLLPRSYLYDMIENTQPKKRGRKPAIKLEVAPQITEIEGEIEGTTIEKLKMLGQQLQSMDVKLNEEPYRMELRVKRGEMLNRVYHLISEL
jgi:hypothetical protein